MPLTIPTYKIFETDGWVVVASADDHHPRSFEVIRKDAERPMAAFLHGASADYFFSCIQSWQAVTPDQEQVEATLSWLSWCNVVPLVVQ